MIFSPGSELLLLLLLLRLRLVVVLSLWLRVPRMDWDCWGWSWRRADTGTTDPTGNATAVSFRIGAVRYGTVFTGQNKTEFRGSNFFSRGFLIANYYWTGRFLMVEDG